MSWTWDLELNLKPHVTTKTREGAAVLDMALIPKVGFFSCLLVVGYILLL